MSKTRKHKNTHMTQDEGRSYTFISSYICNRILHKEDACNHWLTQCHADKHAFHSSNQCISWSAKNIPFYILHVTQTETLQFRPHTIVYERNARETRTDRVTKSLNTICKYTEAYEPLLLSQSSSSSYPQHHIIISASSKRISGTYRSVYKSQENWGQRKWHAQAVISGAGKWVWHSRIVSLTCMPAPVCHPYIRGCENVNEMRRYGFNILLYKTKNTHNNYNNILDI